jgi:hypothetical protein
MGHLDGQHAGVGLSGHFGVFAVPKGASIAKV